MELKLSDKIKRDKDVIFKKVDGVVYILDSRDATLHTLNKTASFVWDQLKIPLSVKDIVSLICNRFEVRKKKAQKDTLKFISTYFKSGFLERVD